MILNIYDVIMQPFTVFDGKRAKSEPNQLLNFILVTMFLKKKKKKRNELKPKLQDVKFLIISTTNNWSRNEKGLNKQIK